MSNVGKVICILLSPQKKKNMRQHLSAIVQLKNSLTYRLVAEHRQQHTATPFLADKQEYMYNFFLTNKSIRINRKT